jgi:hypothetical protein
VSYVQIAVGILHKAARRSDGTVVTGGFIQHGEDWIPTLYPGTSFVQVSAYDYQTAVRVGPTSTYVSYAHGCAGSLPAARLVPRETPRIGQVEEVTVFDLPTNLAIMVFGWNRSSPIDLTPLGMPGCSLHTRIDAVLLLAGTASQAKFLLPIPDQPVLVGMRFCNQALVLDPSAGNALGAVVSDAAEGIVGHW